MNGLKKVGIETSESKYVSEVSLKPMSGGREAGFGGEKGIVTACTLRVTELEVVEERFEWAER